jgi:hypothetical protein
MLNILDYIYLLVFLISFFIIVNDFFMFIYLNDYWFMWLDTYINILIYTLNFILKIAFTLRIFWEKIYDKWRCAGQIASMCIYIYIYIYIYITQIVHLATISAAKKFMVKEHHLCYHYFEKIEKVYKNFVWYNRESFLNLFCSLYFSTN